MKIFAVMPIIALICQMPCLAQAQTPGSHAIEGTWVLQSIYEENDGGEDIDRWGERPTGQFIADASGRFSFQLVGRGAIRFATASSSPACSQTSDREALAYAGKYELDPEQDRIRLEVEDATIIGWDGNHPTASINISQDRLDFVSSTETSPTGAFYTHMVWKRRN